MKLLMYDIKLYVMNFIHKIFTKNLNKHQPKKIVDVTVCPECGAKGYRTSLTHNSYACKKCETWWVGDYFTWHEK